MLYFKWTIIIDLNYRSALEQGAYKTWPVTLQKLTGESTVNVDAFLTYFKPLFEFLKKDNLRFEEDRMLKLLGEFTIKRDDLCEKRTLAEWEYALDILNLTKRDKKEVAIQIEAEFVKTEYENEFKHYDWEELPDNSVVKRQLKRISALGVYKLPEDRIKTYTEILTNMTSLFEAAIICPHYVVLNDVVCAENEAGIALEPGIFNVDVFFRNEYYLRRHFFFFFLNFRSDANNG